MSSPAGLGSFPSLLPLFPGTDRRLSRFNLQDKQPGAEPAPCALSGAGPGLCPPLPGVAGTEGQREGSPALQWGWFGAGSGGIPTPRAAGWVWMEWEQGRFQRG